MKTVTKIVVGAGSALLVAAGVYGARKAYKGRKHTEDADTEEETESTPEVKAQAAQVKSAA